MKLLHKLQQARKDIRDLDPKPEGRNEYSKYDYFTPAQVDRIVSGVCDKHRMIPLCWFRVDEHGLYQEMKLVNLEDPNEELCFDMRTEKGSMSATNEAQQMGGTDTYSERYIKMKVFHIKDNSLDPDSKDNRKEKPVKGTDDVDELNL